MDYQKSKLLGKCSKIFVRQFNEVAGDRHLHLPCNQWKCSICRPQKKTRLSKLVKRCINNYLSTIRRDGFRDLFNIKMLTLTFPGADRRMKSQAKVWRPEYHGDTTIKQACREMKLNFNKLMKALRLQYGDYKYFCIIEPQEDGYPHLHVLLIGGGVGRRKILKDIRRLWVDKYKMGSSMKLEIIKYGVSAGVNYAMKYLSKMTGVVYEGTRIYSVDRHLMEYEDEIEEKEIFDDGYSWETYMVGSCHEDYKGEVNYFPFWDISKSRNKASPQYSDVVPF